MSGAIAELGKAHGRPGESDARGSVAAAEDGARATEEERRREASVPEIAGAVLVSVPLTYRDSRSADTSR